jgi:hypothetical protein
MAGFPGWAGGIGREGERRHIVQQVGITSFLLYSRNVVSGWHVGCLLHTGKKETLSSSEKPDGTAPPSGFFFVMNIASVDTGTAGPIESQNIEGRISLAAVMVADFHGAR